MFVCEPRPPFGQLAGDRRGENKCVFGVEELESTKIQSTRNRENVSGSGVWCDLMPPYDMSVNSSNKTLICETS